MLFTGVIFSITTLNDPLSTQLCSKTEQYLNAYVENLTERAGQHNLNLLDKAALHSGVLTGVAVSWFHYPEASALLLHYVYGDGSDLQLSADYFRKSVYLKKKIAALGIGRHELIGLHQQDDWRLALTLNPYYLDITEQQVVLFHPRIAFASLDAPRVPTIGPIGQLRIRVFDNLVSALEPKSFRAYAVWERSL